MTTTAADTPTITPVVLLEDELLDVESVATPVSASLSSITGGAAVRPGVGDDVGLPDPSLSSTTGGAAATLEVGDGVGLPDPSLSSTTGGAAVTLEVGDDVGLPDPLLSARSRNTEPGMWQGASGSTQL